MNMDSVANDGYHVDDGVVIDDDDDDEHQQYAVAVMTREGVTFDNKNNHSIYCSHQNIRSWCSIIRVVFALLFILLIVNIILIIRICYDQKSDNNQIVIDNNDSNTIATTSTGYNNVNEEDVIISAKLNNATIPKWRPLPESTQLITKLAFGSCASQDIPQPYWDVISLLYNPDIMLLLGDNVYGDCDNESTCNNLREAYKTFSLHPSFRGNQIPILATLDDHDYGQADCYSTNPYKYIAKELFQEFFQIPTLPDDGVYRSYIFGPDHQRVQIIILDTRFARSPFVETGISSSPYIPPQDEIPVEQQQMLSEKQWEWLERQLVMDDIQIQLLISSIQVINNVTGFECWRHLPAEQERLYGLIEKTNSTVIILSGDRHFAGIYERLIGNDSSSSSTKKLIEVTASSLTHTIPLGTYDNCTTSIDCDEYDMYRISGDAIRVNNFGTITIDWDTSEVTIDIRRAESSYGSTYNNNNNNRLNPQHHHGKFSNAGEVLASKTYNF